MECVKLTWQTLHFEYEMVLRNLIAINVCTYHTPYRMGYILYRIGVCGCWDARIKCMVMETVLSMWYVHTVCTPLFWCVRDLEVYIGCKSDYVIYFFYTLNYQIRALADPCGYKRWQWKLQSIFLSTVLNAYNKIHDNESFSSISGLL